MSATLLVIDPQLTGIAIRGRLSNIWKHIILFCILSLSALDCVVKLRLKRCYQSAPVWACYGLGANLRSFHRVPDEENGQGKGIRDRHVRCSRQRHRHSDPRSIGHPPGFHPLRSVSLQMYRNDRVIFRYSGTGIKPVVIYPAYDIYDATQLTAIAGRRNELGWERIVHMYDENIKLECPHKSPFVP